MEILRDDGAVVYVNGKEVYRTNMPQGEITYSVLALSNTGPENAYHKFSIAKNQFEEGINRVSVEIHQSSIRSSDMSFSFKANAYQTDSLTFESTALIYKPKIGFSTTIKIVTSPVDMSDYQSLMINEVVGKNEGLNQSPDGEYPDWIEIYNSGEENLDLAGLTISDSKASFLIPYTMNSTLLKAKEYTVIWANGDDDGDFLNTNFKISSDGEEIVMSLDDFILDSVMVPALEQNTSIGRFGDTHYIFPNPSIGTENPNLFDCSEKWNNGYTLDSCKACVLKEDFVENCSILGIETKSESEALKIKPNPFKSQFTVTAEGSYSIVDFNGVEYGTGYLTKEGKINSENLSPGVYIFILDNGNNIIKEKLIKR